MLQYLKRGGGFLQKILNLHLTLSALTYLKYHKFFEVLDIFARNGINKHIYCYEVHQMNFGVILGVWNSNSRQDFRR